MSDEHRKRSRFDQTDPSPFRRSRFDRRSRSPSLRQSEPKRSRSPTSRNGRNQSPASPDPKKLDPAAAAAAAAAKINAQIQAKKGIQHVDVPPVRSSPTPTTPKSGNNLASSVNGEVYTQDGDYIKDIEVNDLRNRYTLTKGATQKLIKDETGADVTTRGNYYPDKSMATASAPPLYLHVTSTTKEGLEKAIQCIEGLMKQELPNLVDERRFRRREPENFERDELGRRKWPEERIPIDLEPIPGFNLRAQVVGHGGAYVKYIQQETHCRVQIKGRGSGFTEPLTGEESDEAMYLHVASPNANEVKHAKELCEGLLENVKQHYEAFKERGPAHDRGNYNSGYGRGGFSDRGGRDNFGGGYHSGGYNHFQQAGQHSTPKHSASSMSSAPQSSTPGIPGTSTTDYSAQYAQYYGGQDPYAAYGGYQNYVAMYYNYYQQSDQQNLPPGTAPGALSETQPNALGSAPPPPPSEAPPPPPETVPLPPPPHTD